MRLHGWLQQKALGKCFEKVGFKMEMIAYSNDMCK